MSSKPNSSNYNNIIKFVDNIGHTPRKHTKKTVFSLVGVSIIILSIICSGALLTYFASISVDVSVEGVIFVDGQEGATINEQVSCMVGNINTTDHNISNEHTALTYKLDFNVSGVTEGMQVTILNETFHQIDNITIPPGQTVDFHIRYYVLPDADPEDTYTATINIEYMEAV